MRLLFACVGALSVTGAAGPSHIACKQAFAPATGGAIAYRDCGHGDPVVIVPGGPGLDAGYIAPLARIIARQGHRTILIEPRGTGASRAALGGGRQLTVAGSVADVEAVREAAHLDHMSLLGHSFGGGVVQAYAAAHPDHVATLILMDSVGPDMTGQHGPLDGWRKRLTAAELQDYDAARARGDRLAAMKIKFRGSFYHARRGKTFIDGLADSAIHMDVMPLSDAYTRDYHLGAQTGRFRVVILAGAIDWIRGYEPELRATYPGARTVLIPRAGHFPWADAPAATRRALRPTLSE